MKYVALLSGGKDSCFNLLHCALNGHELVAAASLRPEEGKDEIDSYMYQTVGHDAVHLVAQALDVPLYRGVIKGSAVNQSSEYGERNPSGNEGVSGDETEDLFDLLCLVKSNHPDVQGVSVGAILSTYQRIRVEHVCRRLSLTPLAYLWQRDQRELLSEMIETGLEAIIIKVAGVGLMEKHLGQTLAQLQPTLLKLNDLYDLHPCGEGGEYETLTLNSPLFTSRIKLEKTETIIHSDNDFAVVAYLRIKRATLMPKEITEVTLPTAPALVEPRFKEVEHDISVALSSSQLSSCPLINIAREGSGLSSTSYKQNGPWIAVTNVQCPGGPSRTIEDEVRDCFHLLRDLLEENHSLSLAHCSHINIFISSMDLFAQANSVYATFFGSAPPSRACVAVDLPLGTRVRLDVIAYSEVNSGDRQSLHVQGLSYWAPANIGPYSQAITIKNQQSFISGQIGLIPSSLTFPSPPCLALETAMACQHVHRVVEVLFPSSRPDGPAHTQVALYWLQNAEDITPVKKAVQMTEKSGTPTLFLVVSALPKGALIEKQVLIHSGRFELPDEDGELEFRAVSPTYTTGAFKTLDCEAHWQLITFEEANLHSAIICLKGNIDEEVVSELEDRLRPIIPRILSTRLCFLPSRVLQPLPRSLLKMVEPVTYIPCRVVANIESDDWDLAFSVMCN